MWPRTGKHIGETKWRSQKWEGGSFCGTVHSALGEAVWGGVGDAAAGLEESTKFHP